MHLISSDPIQLWLLSITIPDKLALATHQVHAITFFFSYTLYSVPHASLLLKAKRREFEIFFFPFIVCLYLLLLLFLSFRMNVMNR